MPKRIRHSFPIFIAPEITGFYNENTPTAFDEKNLINLNPNDINDKIYIYERQVKEWFLNRASSIISGKNNGFIILMICLAYFEGVEQYRSGSQSNGHSSEFFKRSIRRIYENRFTGIQLNDLYSEARCGLFHNGMVSGKILIDLNYGLSIEMPDSETIRINPKLLIKDIKLDFKNYIRDLRNIANITLRANFDLMFSNI